MTVATKLHPKFYDALSRCTANPKNLPAYEEALHAINCEILPAILGGEWRRANRGFLPMRAKSHVRGYDDLIDHDFLVRRVGKPGRLTWRNSILVSQPYTVISRNGGILPGAWIAGMQLSAGGFGAWVLPGAGPWYPQQTSLVLIGTMLSGVDAEPFGFVSLTP